MPQTVPPIIQELVERFHRNVESYRTQGYNETQLRREFLDPFFEALGWDVSNKDGHAEAYKDVIHEDAIKIGGFTKAPDYCFRIGGTRKFFLEAKKPAINLKEDINPAYQLRRYAWSAKLPLSILTDFEEFAVYDSRTKPKPNDKASTGRILYLTYQEYLDRWDEIASVFSKDAILKGSFDKYAVAKRNRGTATVDKEFLAEIESWRDTLARHLALRNSALTVHDLNFGVQRTIDRLIFLRICEDRGVEHYGQLQALLNGPNTYARLCALYNQADDRYNSGLFHFQKEKGRAEEPDTLTPNLAIDDKVLKDILRRLYYPESPYEFSVFPAEILGQVYEQFLGKVIRLTPGHQAKIEEKPEVKKAGGVYYTPAFIVDYIVKQTVGKLCEAKTPKQIAKLRILDPACGSGSFLIGAFNYLITYHRDWYEQDGPAKHRKELFQSLGGEWRLTTKEKKRILLNNIYGVDIDSQAVEVTKLSLLLKVLEGESEETLKRQLSFIGERALPDLGHNIKCGNSLIGPDYFTGNLLPDEEEMRRVNPFDWNSEFPEITKNGGFDAVIGNPPYVRIQTMKEWAPLEVEAYKKLFHSASKGNYDIYVVFVEKGLSLLNNNGYLGFILPHKFFQAQYGEALRGLIAEGRHLAEVVHFGDQQVFESATTYTCLLFLEKSGSKSCQIKKVSDLSAWRSFGKSYEGNISQQSITSKEWNFSFGSASDLIEKLRNMPVSLRDIAHIFVGLQTDADDVFILNEMRREGAKVLCTSKATGMEHWFEDAHLKPFLKGSLNICRYILKDVTKRLIFPYELIHGTSNLIDVSTYKRRYPLTWEYLEMNKDRLTRRNKGRMGETWYGYVYKKNHTRFVGPKILVPSIAKGSCFAFDSIGNFYFVGSGGGGGGGYGITLHENVKISIPYVLGLLNSRILSHYLTLSSTPFRGGYFAFNRQYIQLLPIRPINFTDPADKARHDQMVTLVQQMLDLHKRLAETSNPNDKTRIQRQIDATDHEIDRLVYDLYELTEEEIAIVEGSSVASSEKACENSEHEIDIASTDQPRRPRRKTDPVATEARHATESGGGASASDSGTSDPVHGVRESTGDYGSTSDPSEESTHQLSSTRYFSTAEGTLSYSQVSERIAVNLAAILEALLQASPNHLTFSPEWICTQHKALAGELFPDWAGRYRDVSLQVGAHTPPPFYEVPTFMRLFCDDLAERLRHISGTQATPLELAALLAWVDWRFQWIHPFQDFNGRIGRVLLAALLYKLTLPHVETASLDPEIRHTYLEALRTADRGDLEPLTDLWLHRMDSAL